MSLEAEYAAQRCFLGHTVHLHDGVWWETTGPFHTKPAFEFRCFPPGQAKPQWSRSFLGYSHQVLERSQANRVMEFMILEGEALRTFSMERLRCEKRSQVRKGFKLCEVRRITDIESCLEDLRQINISQAKRLMEDDTFALSDDYYTTHAQTWKEEMRKRIAMQGHTWWGAFHEGRLIAYMITCLVDTVLFIQVMKTHTDYLKLCATDAIYFTALEHARDTPECQRIVNGGPAREGLNRFKEQFLFRRTEIFYYTSLVRLHRMAKGLVHLKAIFRARCLRLVAHMKAGRT